MDVAVPASCARAQRRLRTRVCAARINFGARRSVLNNGVTQVTRNDIQTGDVRQAFSPTTVVPPAARLALSPLALCLCQTYRCAAAAAFCSCALRSIAHRGTTAHLVVNLWWYRFGSLTVRRETSGLTRRRFRAAHAGLRLVYVRATLRRRALARQTRHPRTARGSSSGVCAVALYSAAAFSCRFHTAIPATYRIPCARRSYPFLRIHRSCFAQRTCHAALPAKSTRMNIAAATISPPFRFTTRCCVCG